MRRAATFFTILLLWFLASLGFVFGSISLFQRISDTDDLNLLIASASRNIYDSPNRSEIGGELASILGAVAGQDARPVLVNRFLAKYGSPMRGLGKEFVATADRYGLDWRLLPAIAFQESNLGKKVPKGSHNPFGWAIYEGRSSGAQFTSWEQAIRVTAAGVRSEYLDKGYTTPETIVAKYTSGQNASWVFAVRSAMSEIADFEY